jgi:hypothetical protein
MLLRDVLVLPDSPLSAQFRAAISAADRVHTVCSIPPVPVAISSRRNENGAYVRMERPRRAIRIEISRYGSHPALTLLHEVGHMLDHWCLNRIGAGFASENRDPSFDRLYEIMETDSLLIRLHKQGSALGGKTSAGERRYFREMLFAREVWARCYSQWVATKSGDDLLLGQLEKVRVDGSYFAGKWCTFHWDTECFKPIMDAVDKLMSEFELI